MASGRGAIEGVDQVAATIAAVLISSGTKADELAAVNLFFKIRHLLIDQDQQNLAMPPTTRSARPSAKQVARSQR